MSRQLQLRYQPGVECLETWLLPAASLKATLAQGVLNVAGTSGNDQIEVRVKVLGVSRGAVSRVSAQVLVNNRMIYNRTARITAVRVDAGLGDDRVTVVASGKLALPAWLLGEDGNDTLIGGAGQDVILGGPGSDQLWGSGSDLVDGGADRDQVNGVLDALPAPPPVSPPVSVPITQAPDPAPTVPPPVVTPPVWNAAAVVQEIIQRTNAARVEAGVGTLTVSDKLTRIAQIQADQMASLNRMEHTLPEAQYPTLQSRSDAVGYNFTRLGENIAYNYPDAANVMLGWLLSQGHRDNMLHPDFLEIGVAVAQNRYGEPYYVQVFGRPY